MAAPVTIPLTFAKATSGTNVFANEDMGMKGVYLPKLLTPGGPEGYTVTLVISKKGTSDDITPGEVSRAISKAAGAISDPRAEDRL